ncbi:ABC transporter permease [Desulfofundulus sp.]|uniref:ABC transporter permease n=1 Tax=Desulfofundulus sp. TaxID=2282750 RepID=UPI003C763CE4
MSDKKNDISVPLPLVENKVFHINFISLMRNYGVIIATFLVFVFLSVSNTSFFSLRNISNIFDQSAEIGIMTAAYAIAIISGNFDLSGGAIFALCGSLAAMIAQSGHPELGLFTAVAVSLFIGLINGLAVTLLRIHSFIATLASGLIIQGVAFVLTNGNLFVVDNHRFAVLGQGKLFGISYPTYLFMLFAIVTGILLSRTTFGRYVYAIGGNIEAARLSGVRVDLMRIIIFGLTGLSAGLASAISVSRICQGHANMGGDLALEAIARAVVGGVSILGGEGTILGATFGVFLLRLIENGFNILNVPPFYQYILEGAVIFFAVAMDTLTKERARS